VSRCTPADAQAFTLGVDTHKDVHVAVALDGIGRRLGTLSVPANPAGYEKLADWAEKFGPLEHAGVEGTGSFGAGLARFLRAQGIRVYEVIRPKRRDQYRSGKSDPIDAEAAARRTCGHRIRPTQRRRRPGGDDPYPPPCAPLRGEG
jgi:transposase